MPRLRLAPLLCGALLAPLACAGGWESPDEVRRAVLAAGVRGQPPAEAERRRAALRFADGRRLALDPFRPDRAVVEAQLRDAAGRPRTGYNVNVTVHFDAAGLADSVEVFTSGASPF